MTSKILFAFAILTAAYAPTVLSSSPICDIFMSDICEYNSYANIHLNDNASPGNTCPLSVRCLAPHEPPVDLTQICTISGNQFLCEAWPQGKDDEDFTYDWFATGRLSVGTPSPSSSPLQTISCNPGGGSGGFVSVVVTSPYGLSSTYFQALSCP